MKIKVNFKFDEKEDRENGLIIWEDPDYESRFDEWC